MKYIAIIGDIKGSKEVIERKEVQQRLNKVLEQVNIKYKGDLASKFIITLGDEFQGLLKSSDYILEIIKCIQRNMYPVAIRFGVGIGEISTDINPEAAIGSDGPAYYAARAMIEDLRKKEEKYKTQAADIQFCIYGENPFEIEQINILLALIALIENKWKAMQRITIWDMIENGGSQKECAIRLKTSQSTVARRLVRGDYYLYEETMKVTSKLIEVQGFNK